jgi:ribosome-associated translation inhibitor RaiA
MRILVNGGRIDEREGMTTCVETKLRAALGWFSRRITRVTVHLRDVNGHKGGARDKRCVMEVRLRSRQPVAVTHEAATLSQAVGGAAVKLKRFVESTVGRLQRR